MSLMSASRVCDTVQTISGSLPSILQPGDVGDNDDEDDAVDFAPSPIDDDDTGMYGNVDEDDTLLQEDWCLTTTFSSAALSAPDTLERKPYMGDGLR